MGKKKKNNIKKRQKKSKIKVAKKQQASKEFQSNTIGDLPKDLTFFQKIEKYKKWFSFGVFSFFLLLYVQYYPDDINITSEVLNKGAIMPNAIKFNNTNSYDIKNVKITVLGVTDQVMVNKESLGINFNNIAFVHGANFETVRAKNYKHISPKFSVRESETVKIKRYFFDIIYSFDTPFIYPNFEGEIQSFSGYLNPDGDVIFLNN